MSLLGWPLLVVLGMALVGSVGLALAAWSRVRGPAPVRAAQRVGMLGLSQLTALLLVAAAVNNYGYFYGSWSDLFGGSSTPRVQASRAAPQGHFGRLGAVTGGAVGTALAWSTPAQYAVRGRVAQLTIHGQRSGLVGDALVYQPPQYFQPAYRHHLFPAVEVFTGYPGLVTNLVNRQHYPDSLLAQIAAHRANPMVLVMLRPTITPPRDTECTDVPAGPQALTYFSEDVPSAVEGVLRVRPLGWGAMGDSTGGYCAVKLAMTHSDVFGAAASLSGYYHTLKDSTTGDLWAGSAVLRNLNDPEWLLAHQPPPPVSLFITIGTAERGTTGVVDTRAFLSLVRLPLSVTSVFIPGGGHNFANWDSVMPSAFHFLSQRLGA